MERFGVCSRDVPRRCTALEKRIPGKVDNNNTLRQVISQGTMAEDTSRASACSQLDLIHSNPLPITTDTVPSGTSKYQVFCSYSNQVLCTWTTLPYLV